MPPARFCSVCGDKLKRGRASSPGFLSSCARCGRFDYVRLTTFVLPILFLAIGFAIGYYSKSREPFQYIGTAIESSVTAALPSVDARAPGTNVAAGRSTETANTPVAIEAICGARTKSGRPCQRKVKGGGRCWQHRDK